MLVLDRPLIALDEAARDLGLTPEGARRLWRAVGLPDPPEGATLRDDDADLLALVAAGVHDDESLEAGVQHARVIGAALTRIAESEGDAIGDDPQAAARAHRLVDALHRRHLEAALARRQDRADAGLPVAIGFVDLVGFTAISRRLADVELSRLLSRFENLTHEVVTEHGGRVVKTIGDEAMFALDNPAAAVMAGLHLTAGHADDAGLPDVHVGIAYGSALARDGDYFGAVVNLGRRITDVSPPGAVVVSDELRIALADDLDFEWKSLGPRDLKDVGAVPLWTVRPATTAADALRVLESLARGDIDVDQALALIPS